MLALRLDSSPSRIDPYNTARIGVLDTKHYSDIENRAWVFRTVGYGTADGGLDTRSEHKSRRIIDERKLDFTI